MAHDGFIDKGRRDLNLLEPRIEEVLPQYFTTQYPKFISLLERYYEFEKDSASPTELIGHLFESRDINQTDLSLLSFIEDELLLGSNYSEGFLDKRAAANFSSQIFRAKGTKYSIEWFFRAFFGIDPEIFYPKKNVFLLAGVDSDTLDSKIGAGYEKFITNDKLYQTFALQIKSELGVEEWENIYKLFVHPAGMYLGSRYVINAEAELNGLDSDIVNNLISSSPSAEFTLSADNTGPNENDVVTFTVGGSNIPSQYYYWYVDLGNINPDDIVQPYPTINNREPILVTANSATFDLTIGFQSEQEASKNFTVILSDEPFTGAVNGARGTLASRLIAINDVAYNVSTTGGSVNAANANQDATVVEGNFITFNISAIGGSFIPDTPIFMYSNAPSAFTSIDSDDLPIVNHDILSGKRRQVFISGGTGSTSISFLKNIDATGDGQTESFIIGFEDDQGRNLLSYATDQGLRVNVSPNLPSVYTISATPVSPSEGISGTAVSFNVTGTNLEQGDSSTYIGIVYEGTTTDADFETVPPGNGATPRELVTLVSVDGGLTGAANATDLITVKQDATVETNQDFRANLYDAITGGSIISTTGTISITDTNFTLTPSPTFANEGTTVTFDVSGSGITQSGSAYWQMDYNTADSADFENHPSSTGDRRAVLITSGNNPEGSFTVDIKNDVLNDGGLEQFSTSIWTAPTGGVQLATSGNVTIADTSQPAVPDITYTLTAPAGNVTEGDAWSFTVVATLINTGTYEDFNWNITGDSRVNATGTITAAQFSSGSGTVTVNRTSTNDPIYQGSTTITVNGTGATYGNSGNDTFSLVDEAAQITGITGPTTITDGGTAVTLSIDPTTVAALEADAAGGNCRGSFTLTSTGDFTVAASSGATIGTIPSIGADNWAPAASQAAGFGDNYQVQILTYDTTNTTFGTGTLDNSVFTGNTTFSASNNVGSQTWTNNTSHWYRLDADWTLEITSGIVAPNDADGNRRMVDIEIKEFDGTNYGSGTTLLQHRLQLIADFDAT